MSLDQLHVEDSKDKVKDAAGENLKDATKKVDEFIKNIKTVTNAAEKKSEKEADTKLSDAKKADKNKEVKKGIKKENADAEISAIEKTTISEFLKTSPAIITAITDNLSNNFEKIGTTNGYADISVFEDAKKAFSDDINTFKTSKNYDVTMVDNMKIVDKAIESLQDRTDLKQIQETPAYVNNFDKAKLATFTKLAESIKTPTDKDEIAKLATLKKTLSDKTITLKEAETNALTSLLNIEKPDISTAKKLFETDKLARNALLSKEWTNLTTPKTDQQKNFEGLLKLYAGNIQEVDSYEIKNFGDDAKGLTTLSNKDSRDTKYDYIKIHLKEIEKKEKVAAVGTTPETPEIPKVEAKDKDIFFGASTDAIYEAKAENYTGIRTDTGTIQKNLETLDTQGSYAEFEDILTSKGTEASTFLSGLIGGGLLKDINTYDSKDDNNTKTNGYYGVILDYISETNDQGLMSIYLNSIVSGSTINLKYLGTDFATQQANFLKLKNWKIDPTSENGKLLAKIQLQLVTDNPKSFQETFSQGLDAMVKAFGPMLLGILKMFGVSRGKLEKLFGKTRIDKMYKEEYGLSEKAIEAVTDIYKNGKFETGESKNKLDTGEQLKTEFDAAAKAKYITLIEDKTNGYYKYINVSTIKAGLATYNKTLKINDVVTIITDSTTGKQSITEILPGKEKEFEGAMTKILDDDATWNNIATANASIQEPTVENKVSTGYNQQGLKTGEKSDAERYKIKTQADIARYLTASLFSSKDLSFVMTENKLHNGVVLAKDEVTPVVDKPKEVLAYKNETTDFKDKKLTVAGAKKMIHEVIDIDKAPAKITITRENGTIINCTLNKTYTDTKITTAIATYTDNKTSKRVQIFKGDSFTIPETVKTDSEIYTENRAKINGTDGIKNIKTEKTISKYGTLDINSFTYDKVATDEDTVAYQNNILTPLETTLTDKIQYPLLITDLSDATKKATYEGLFSSPKNLANMLSILDTRDNSAAPKYLNAITNLGKIGDTYTMTADKTTNTITIKNMTGTKENGTITIKNTDGKLTADRKETDAIPAKT